MGSLDNQCWKIDSKPYNSRLNLKHIEIFCEPIWQVGYVVAIPKGNTHSKWRIRVRPLVEVFKVFIVWFFFVAWACVSDDEYVSCEKKMKCKIRNDFSSYLTFNKWMPAKKYFFYFQTCGCAIIFQKWMI